MMKKFLLMLAGFVVAVFLGGLFLIGQFDREMQEAWENPLDSQPAFW